MPLITWRLIQFGKSILFGKSQGFPQSYVGKWKKDGSTHSFEADFLITSKNKVIPIEVKSSAAKNHKSIDNFEIKYSKQVGARFLLSQKDVGRMGILKLKPVI